MLLDKHELSIDLYSGMMTDRDDDDDDDDDVECSLRC